jgi:hypothetical protein
MRVAQQSAGGHLAYGNEQSHGGRAVAAAVVMRSLEDWARSRASTSFALRSTISLSFSDTNWMP